MSKPYRKSYQLFYLWLAAVGIVCVIFPLEKLPLRFFGQTKSYCIALFLLLDLLFLLMWRTGAVYWLSGVSYEEAASAPLGERRRFAGKHLLCFAGATLCYVLYCLANKYWMSTVSIIQDALVAAGLICAAVLLTGKIRLEREK